MKKIINISIALSVLAMTLVSCEEGWKGTIYEGPADEAVFVNDEVTYAFGASDAEKFTIDVLRGISTSAASVAITASGDAAAKFTIPTTVDFAAGEANAQIEITFDKTDLVLGEENSFTLTLPDVQVTTANVACEVVVIRDFSWASIGDATVTSVFNCDADGVPAVYTSEIWKDESSNVYKLDLLGLGEIFQFEINADNSLTIKNSGVVDGTKSEPAALVGCVLNYTGYMYQGVAPCYLATDTDVTSSFYTPATKIVKLTSLAQAIYHNGNYIGSFGTSIELIQIP